MTSNQVYKRQMRLLSKAAKKAQYRTNEKIDIEKGFPSITADSRSDDAYDFNKLCEYGFLWQSHMTFRKTGTGMMEGERPSLSVTDEGLAQVRDFERSWLSKAIEKQPMTALGIVVALGEVLVAALLAYWTWALSEGKDPLFFLRYRPALLTAEGGPTMGSSRRALLPVSHPPCQPVS